MTKRFHDIYRNFRRDRFEKNRENKMIQQKQLQQAMTQSNFTTFFLILSKLHHKLRLI